MDPYRKYKSQTKSEGGTFLNGYGDKQDRFDYDKHKVTKVDKA